MGAGREKRPMHEIAETRASARDDAFEELIERIKGVAEDFKDDVTPLYTDIGEEEFEIGEKRTITFTIAKQNFELIRKEETHHISGAGRQKHIEEITNPRATDILKRKSQYDQTWEVMDLEDMF